MGNKKPKHGLTHQKSLVVRVMQPKTKLVNGKMIVIHDDSLNWEVSIYLKNNCFMGASAPFFNRLTD